jgi:hypothetical protein
MDAEFANAVASWNGFYSAIAGAAATLVGLLFVSLALNPAMMSDTGPNGLRIWSAQTFHNFLIVLAIALVALIPDISPTGFAIPLAIFGIQGIYRVVTDFRTAYQDPNPIWHGRIILARFGTPAIAYGILIWSAFLSYRADDDALGWLVVVIFLLVISASSSCWELLKGIGDQHDAANGGAQES